MIKETVLYYNPNKAAHSAKLKSVFVRMGIRIKNITPDQVHETVGYLAGIPGFEASENPGDDMSKTMDEEMLVMKDFTSRRIDELLMSMRRSGVPKIALKAVITEYNAGWPFSKLYEEIKKEHEQMSRPQAAPEQP